MSITRKTHLLRVIRTRSGGFSGSRRWATLVVGLVLLASPGGATTARPVSWQQADNARQLLQRAVHLEEAMGDPEAAIETYERVISAPDADAPLAAVAEFRLAVLLSRIGRGPEARTHHRRITESYARDPRLEEIVRMAREALGEPSGRGSGRAMVARRLWEGSEAYAFGSLSPDGSFLSFVDWGSGSGNLAIHDLDRGIESFLTDLDVDEIETYACSTVVSPTGRRIAYTWYSPDVGHTVHLISRNGNNDRVLTVVGKNMRHLQLEGWSRSDNALLAIKYSVDGNEIVMISVQDGSMRTVRALGIHAPESARLSPDGHRIAYHLLDEQSLTHDVVLTSIDGEITTTLVGHPANDLLPVWTPDGEHVLFVSDRTGTLGAWVVEVSGGVRRSEDRLVKSDFGRSIPMGFTEQGALVYALQSSLSDIYTAELEMESGTMGMQVASSGRFVGVNRTPAWSSDGNRLAYLSDRGPLPTGLGPTSLVIRDLQSGSEQVLSPEIRNIQAPRWHPGQDAVLVLGTGADSRQAIFRIDAKYGTVVPFLTWEDTDCDCVTVYAAAPDGNRVAYFRPSGVTDRGDLVLRNLGRRAERVLLAGLSAATLGALEFSPDGRTLAMTVRRRGRNGPSWVLQLLDLVSGGMPAVLANLGSDSARVDLIGWTPGGEGLLLARANDSGRSLRYVSADGVSSRTIVASLPRDLREISLHPDGETLAYTTGQYRAEIWMLENPLVEVHRD